MVEEDLRRMLISDIVNNDVRTRVSKVWEWMFQLCCLVSDEISLTRLFIHDSFSCLEETVTVKKPHFYFVSHLLFQW